MQSLAVATLFSYVELACYFCALFLMHHRRQLVQYRPLALLLLSKLLTLVILLPVESMSGHQLSRTAAYHIYFYWYWTSYIVEAGLGFFIIYSVYDLAMAPLRGLHRLGMLMFRWAAGIAMAIALTMAFGPHVASSSFLIRVITQLQQTQSVLTLCMLLFVCMAIRPMGLTFRSKIFGVSLGLGVLATSQLVSSAWFSQFKFLYSMVDIFNGAAICVAILIWIGYFAIPEPKRRMIILPTTSPFLRWNQISLALGDEPGYVALGDVTPDMFAPAEVEVMRRASMKMGYRATN